MKNYLSQKVIVAKTMKPFLSNSPSKQIFLMWPNLIDITERFCNFMSPLLLSTGSEHIASHSIHSAINAYKSELNPRLKGKAYVLELLESANYLSRLTILGIREDKVITWKPYVEPILSWMIKNNVKTIQTIQNERPSNPNIARLAMMVHILSAQEISDMDLFLTS